MERPQGGRARQWSRRYLQRVGSDTELSVHHRSQTTILISKLVKAKSHGSDNDNDYDAKWLKCSSQKTPTLIQAIEGVHCYHSRFRSCYRGRCDRAFRVCLITFFNITWVSHKRAPMSEQLMFIRGRLAVASLVFI